MSDPVFKQPEFIEPDKPKDGLSIAESIVVDKREDKISSLPSLRDPDPATNIQPGSMKGINPRRMPPTPRLEPTKETDVKRISSLMLEEAETSGRTILEILREKHEGVSQGMPSSGNPFNPANLHSDINDRGNIDPLLPKRTPVKGDDKLILTSINDRLKKTNKTLRRLEGVLSPRPKEEVEEEFKEPEVAEDKDVISGVMDIHQAPESVSQTAEEKHENIPVASETPITRNLKDDVEIDNFNSKRVAMSPFLLKLKKLPLEEQKNQVNLLRASVANQYEDLNLFTFV